MGITPIGGAPTFVKHVREREKKDNKNGIYEMVGHEIKEEEEAKPAHER